MNRLSLLTQVCEQCIDYADADKLKDAVRSFRKDMHTALTLGQVSGAMVHKVLIPSVDKCFPLFQIGDEAKKKVTDTDVMAEIFSDGLETDIPGLRPLI